MITEPKKQELRSKKFTKTLETRITQETPSPANPYQAESIRIHGYDHLELVDKLDFSDMVFLMFRGERPGPEEATLFRRLCTAMVNPGPRHPATQASIVAGVGKTDPLHILPIALSIYGGEFDGAAPVENAIRLFRKSLKLSPVDFLKENDPADIPGFGTLYGDPCPYTAKLLNYFLSVSRGKTLAWVAKLQTETLPLGFGLLRSGLTGAILADLGFQPRVGGALLQFMAAPGLAAQGLEYANKPLSSMLFEPDDVYEIEE